MQTHLPLSPNSYAFITLQHSFGITYIIIITVRMQVRNHSSPVLELNFRKIVNVNYKHKNVKFTTLDKSETRKFNSQRGDKG